jgi:hypothetical protein
LVHVRAGRHGPNSPQAVLERFHSEWKRSALWFASNSINLIRSAIPLRLILL